MNKLETRWSFGRSGCNFMTEYSSVDVVNEGIKVVTATITSDLIKCGRRFRTLEGDGTGGELNEFHSVADGAAKR